MAYRNPMMMGPDRMNPAGPDVFSAVSDKLAGGPPIMPVAETETYPRQSPAGLWERFLIWLGAQGQDAQPASRDVAEGINRMLPDSVGGRAAYEKLRERERAREAQLNSI